MGGGKFFNKKLFFLLHMLFRLYNFVLRNEKRFSFVHIIGEIIPILGGFATLSNFCSLC